MSALEGATCGAIGAVVGTAVTFPLASAKTRLQAQRKDRARARAKGDASGPVPYTSTVDCIVRVIREEGPGNLFAGLVPALGKAAVGNFVFYYFFSALGNLYFARASSKSMIASLLHGMSAGAGVQLVMLPSDLVITRMMASGSNAGFWSSVGAVVRTGGLFALWDGLGPGLMLTLNPGITTLVRQRLTNTLAGRERDGKSAGPSANFWIGMLSKACASTVTYPTSLLKVRMQVQGMRTRGMKRSSGPSETEAARTEEERESGVNRGDGCYHTPRAIQKQRPGAGSNGANAQDPSGARAKPMSMTSLVKAILAESGPIGLYRGLLPQLVNAMLKEAVLNAVRLEIAAFVSKLFRILRRLVARDRAAAARRVQQLS